MKRLLPIIIFSLIILLSGCSWLNGTSNSEDGLSKRRKNQVTIIVQNAYNDPIPQVSVEMNGKPIGITDLEGKCIIADGKSILNKTADFRIKRPDIKLDETKNLKVKLTTVIITDLNIGTEELLSKKIDQRKDELQNFSKKLNQINRLLNHLEDDIDSYILKNGESAIKNYKAQISSSRILMQKLGDKIKSLKQRYQRTLDETSGEEIADIQIEETEFDWLSNRMKNLTRQTNATADAIEDNIEVNPNYSIPYYFATGAYKPLKSYVQVNEELDIFLKKLMKFRNAKYAEYSDEQLTINITSIGYTDGEPINAYSTLALDLRRKCNNTTYSESSYTDLNYCLGYQRAKEIIDIIRPKIKIQNAQLEFDSQGPILANGATSPNAALRKCIISFQIFPKKLLQIGNAER